MNAARLWLLLIAAWPGLLPGAGEVPDFESLRALARARAAQPWVQPASPVPEWMRRLTYDEHRRIRFDPIRTVWRAEQRPFQLQFFHPGWLFDRVVAVSELRGREAVPVAFAPDHFIYDGVAAGPVPPSLGFAGFKILFPLNQSADELGAFLGASYFRLLCRRSVYGLSARGLAVNTAEPAGEEFPAFTAFWVERPAPDAKRLAVLALLEGPSVAGAYRLEITPGDETVVGVRAAVFWRQGFRGVGGLAPLTSMYWRGENQPGAGVDFRPEVHDSDGLLIHTGAGERLWRPLSNPRQVRVMSFADAHPRGFGLLQRDRDFDHYQDLEATYQARPSAWVEPVGDWGQGAVRLVELPTGDEFSDNIVAFWVPGRQPPAGEALDFEYRLHWFLDEPDAPGGRVAATRIGRSAAQEPDRERVLVDFEGPELRSIAAATPPEAVVDVGPGARLLHTGVQRVAANGRWRVVLTLRAEGSAPVEMRCFLRAEGKALTETWSHLWQP